MKANLAPLLAAVSLWAALAQAGGAPGTPNFNAVLLHDADEIRAYVDAFPFDQHMLVKYPNMGCRLSALPSSIIPCLYDWLMEPVVGTFWIESERPRGSIKEIILRGGIWEPYVNRLVKEYAEPGTAAVDVGAYMGIHSMLMGRMVGDSGQVYAFEPQRKMYRELVHNIALNDLEDVVLPLRFALGAHRAVIEMDAAAVRTFSGPAGPSAVPILEDGSVSVGAGGDKAELRPLDDFNLTGVSLIKIDVEGHEAEVLKGAQATIAANRPVVVLEILGGVASYPGAETMYDNPTAGPEHLAAIHATWRLLEQQGYEVRPVSDHDYVAFPLEMADAAWPPRIAKAAQAFLIRRP